MTIYAQVQLRRGDGEVIILPVGNISTGGIFLELDAGVGLRGFRVGEPVHVFLDLPAPGDDLSFAGEAEVVRVDVMASAERSPGLALRWTSTDPAFAPLLVRVIERIPVR